MNKFLENYIEKEIPNEEDPDSKYWQDVQYKTKHIHSCTVWRCTTCHPNSKPLTKSELIKIRAKIQMRKKPRKLKECKHEWCAYCQRYIKKANQYIAMENREIQEYNTKRENAPNLSSNHDDDIIMKEEDTTKEIKESSTNPNINDYERIKVQGGGNCAFRAILTTA